MALRRRVRLVARYVCGAVPLFPCHGLTRTGAGGGIANEKIVTHLVPLKEVAAFTTTKRDEGLTIDCRPIAFLPWANLA